MDRVGLARGLKPLGLNHERARAAVDAFFDQMADVLNRGRAVSIVGFGKWEWRTQPAKDALDPRTGTPRRVPARRKVGFKPSERLKSELNPGAGSPGQEGGRRGP